MKFHTVATIITISALGLFVIDFATGQVDALNNIEFMQTGILYTDEHSFHISNDIMIREFSNGNIVRISGQTVEGFPYITYSEIQDDDDDDITTRGIIYINGKFTNLLFEEKIVQPETTLEKDNDISVLAKYTQRVYSKEVAQIEIKVFDKKQNTLDDFYQNYGRIADAKIMIKVTNEQNQEIFSAEGITDKTGFFSAEFIILDNSKKETLTVTINAENENSKESKILQIFSLGNRIDKN